MSLQNSLTGMGHREEQTTAALPTAAEPRGGSTEERAPHREEAPWGGSTVMMASGPARGSQSTLRRV